jgi:hypothetical protein
MAAAGYTMLQQEIASRTSIGAARKQLIRMGHLGGFATPSNTGSFKPPMVHFRLIWLQWQFSPIFQQFYGQDHRRTSRTSGCQEITDRWVQGQRVNHQADHQSDHRRRTWEGLGGLSELGTDPRHLLRRLVAVARGSGVVVTSRRKLSRS